MLGPTLNQVLIDLQKNLLPRFHHRQCLVPRQDVVEGRDRQMEKRGQFVKSLILS